MYLPSAKSIVEVIAGLTMAIGLGLVVYHRLKSERGLTPITAQFLAIIFVFPTILVLGLEGVIKGETASTLIGTLAGYLFAEFGKRRPTQQNPDPNP
jgi:hypothetical protein